MEELGNGQQASEPGRTILNLIRIIPWRIGAKLAPFLRQIVPDSPTPLEAMQARKARPRTNEEGRMEEEPDLRNGPLSSASLVLPKTLLAAGPAGEKKDLRQSWLDLSRTRIPDDTPPPRSSRFPSLLTDVHRCRSWAMLGTSRSSRALRRLTVLARSLGLARRPARFSRVPHNLSF